MTTAQVVETSVTNNGLSKGYPHPKDNDKPINKSHVGDKYINTPQVTIVKRDSELLGDNTFEVSLISTGTAMILYLTWDRLCKQAVCLLFSFSWLYLALTALCFTKLEGLMRQTRLEPKCRLLKTPHRLGYWLSEYLLFNCLKLINNKTGSHQCTRAVCSTFLWNSFSTDTPVHWCTIRG